MTKDEIAAELKRLQLMYADFLVDHVKQQAELEKFIRETTEQGTALMQHSLALGENIRATKEHIDELQKTINLLTEREISRNDDPADYWKNGGGEN